MTDPIEKAREIFDFPSVQTPNRIREVGNAALDCLEALREPRWGCSRCDHACDIRDEAEFHVLGHKCYPEIPKPVVLDLHADAWKKFEEALGE
jgi:hypothetical protein